MMRKKSSLLNLLVCVQSTDQNISKDFALQGGSSESNKPDCHGAGSTRRSSRSILLISERRERNCSGVVA